MTVLCWSIIPLESFHHHEEHTVVCTDAFTHLEEIAFGCDLADFVLPIFTENKNSFNFDLILKSKELRISQAPFTLDLRLATLNTRGPPKALEIA